MPRHRSMLMSRCAAMSIVGLFAMPSLAQAQTQDTNTAAETGGEIVVTAQRRSENLQDVPISVSVVSPEQVEQLNLRTIENIQLVTPGLVFNTSYGFNQTFIRGVGSAFSTPGLEMAVPTYYDGAYLTRGEGSVFELLDIASVQVLKGPQGTLYGRNATGGVILLNTANPTDEFEGHVAAEYGRFNRVQLESVVNAPLSETLAVRLAARYVDHDGFITNLYNGKKLGGRESYTVRGKIAFRPSTAFSAILAAEYNHNRIRRQADGSASARSTLHRLRDVSGIGHRARLL